jgi:hypothetical protein
LVLGTLYNLEISAKPSALVGFVVVWLILSALGLFVIRLPLAASIVGGLACACLHWLSELLHHLGHAGAARNTGYPMRGVRFVHILAVSLYPKEEPPLPSSIHIRRALGGPAVSFLVTVIAFLLLLIAQFVGGFVYWVALWFFLDNLLFFTFGALLPLSFTDGGTLVKYWRKP